jgi:hypothetical protein
MTKEEMECHMHDSKVMTIHLNLLLARVESLEEEGGCQHRERKQQHCNNNNQRSLGASSDGKYTELPSTTTTRIVRNDTALNDHDSSNNNNDWMRVFSQNNNNNSNNDNDNGHNHHSNSDRRHAYFYQNTRPERRNRQPHQNVFPLPPDVPLFGNNTSNNATTNASWPAIDENKQGILQVLGTPMILNLHQFNEGASQRSNHMSWAEGVLAATENPPDPKGNHSGCFEASIADRIFQANLGMHHFVDARDEKGSWRVAEITAIQGNDVIVRFFGVSEHTNTRLYRYGADIAPLKTHLSTINPLPGDAYPFLPRSGRWTCCGCADYDTKQCSRFT